MPNQIPIHSMPIAAHHADLPECTTFSPMLQLSSTPFSTSAMPERFEYPFPVTQTLLLFPPALLLAAITSTQTLANCSIVPPGDSGRGMGLSSTGSFSPPAATVVLPYPSASASDSQVLEQIQAGALPTRTPYIYDRHHYTAAQLCAMASAHSPMPPSLALKRGLQLKGAQLERRGTSCGGSGIHTPGPIV